MSILVHLLSRLARDNSGSIKFLHKTVKNWHSVMLLLAGARKSLNVRLRNGKSYRISVLENHVAAYYKNKELKFRYRSNQEKIHAILMLIGEFFDEPHSGLDVHGRIVVDIGAYIGDTPIYFALNGAKHVYALEPYPYSYELAKENVMANNLSGKITMVNAGCGSSNGIIRINADYKNLAGSGLDQSKSGKSVPIMSLESIARKYRLKNAALKIDCEGCEYDIVLKSKRETLRKFSRILIEYHYGYTRLEKKLKVSGFKVRHTEPEYMKNANTKDQNMYGGEIFAELKG